MYFRQYLYLILSIIWLGSEGPEEIIAGTGKKSLISVFCFTEPCLCPRSSGGLLYTMMCWWAGRGCVARPGAGCNSVQQGQGEQTHEQMLRQPRPWLPRWEQGVGARGDCGNANLHGNWQKFQGEFWTSEGKRMGVFKIAFPIVHGSGQSQLSLGLCQKLPK